MAWGGARPGAGRKPTPGAKKANPRRAPARAEPKLRPSTAVTVPAEASDGARMPAIDPNAWAMMLPEIEEISRKYSVKQQRGSQNNPFKLPAFPKLMTEQLAASKMPTMAMDNALTSNLNYAGEQWMAGGTFAALPGEGLEFLGFTYLTELAQRPEFRVMSETIADDATRKWIDFDVVGDEKKQREDREKDPQGYDERMADPDERKKRVAASGKTDKVKALKDDQLRMEVKDRFYEQWRNDGFFGRSHLFLDIRAPGSDEISPEELKTSIGDSRDKTSQTKCQKGFFQGMRTIEPVWTYPLMYNAINPLRKDWYNPQTWFVMGQEIDGTRCQTFIGHPVPDMLKPAYAFSGLSLTQMAKPYVDIWLQTRQSIAQLIHSFSVMVLMTDLSTLMQPNNLGNLLARVAMFNMFRDNQGAFVVNKNTEDFKNVSASLSGLHELQAQAQEHMASVHRIPLVKFTGIQPSGLNASSEGEIEVYDDTIMASQSRFGDPNLRRVINFQQLSLWGEIDPEITHRWEPLRPISQAEKGQKEKDDADRNQKYVDMGAISPGEVRKVIVNDKELPYTEFDPEDVPDLQQEEEDGLEPAGGRPDPKAGGDDEPGTGAPGAGPGRGTPGGGATDADLPFVFDAWNEGDHPRSENGQFGSGGAGKDPRSAHKAVKKAKFGEAGGAVSEAHTELESLNSDIELAFNDMMDITPEDRFDLEDGEEFAAESKFREGLERAPQVAAEVRNKVAAMLNKAGGLLGRESIDANREPDAYVSPAAASKIESLAADLSGHADAVESAAETLKDELDDPDADDEVIEGHMDDLRLAIEDLHDEVGEALAEIDQVLNGNHDEVREEEAEQANEFSRWSKMSAAEREAEEKAQRRAQAQQRAKEDADRKKDVGERVEKALANGWKPKFNEFGTLHRDTPPELAGLASPASFKEIYRKLHEKGIDLPDASKRWLAPGKGDL